MSQNSAPHDPKIWAFALLYRLFEYPILRSVKHGLKLVFVQLAPEVPTSLSRSTVGQVGIRVGAVAALATLLFCFVVPAVWASMLGTFSGDDPSRMYFSRDTINLILYLVVCPLYVGLGVWLWIVVIKYSGGIRDYAINLDSQAERNRMSWLRQFLLLTVVMAVSLFATANYIADITDPARVAVDYWFVKLMPSGDRSIGPLGVYYFLINFVLLTITLISIMFFMSIFSAVFSVGTALQKYEQPNRIDLGVIRLKLEAFTEAYLLGKALTFLYMLNILMWQSSPLGNTENLWIAALFASLIGVVFVSLPRYFVELQWFRYRERTGQLPVDDPSQHQDIRPFYVQVSATIFDTLLIGGFIMSFWPEYILSLTKQ